MHVGERLRHIDVNVAQAVRTPPVGSGKLHQISVQDLRLLQRLQRTAKVAHLVQQRADARRTAGDRDGGAIVLRIGLRAFGAQRERAAAYDLSMVLDGNGDPAMAFIFYDPNADSVPIDTRIEFRSWNRAV